MNTEMFLFYNKWLYISNKRTVVFDCEQNKDFHFELKRVNFYPVSLSVTLK